MKKDIVCIVNNLSKKFPFPQYDFDVKGAYDCIFGYCKTNGVRHCAVTMEGGILVIDGKKVGRVVTTRSAKPACGEGAAFWEGRILARQETMFD